MRDIIFKQVGLQNFKSYTEQMVVDFIPNQIVLIIGPNGVGKTSIFDAIPFSFYGATSSGAKGDDVVNNKIGKNCKTWVDFSINDIPYRIERYHKYSGGDIHGNTVHLFENDVLIKRGHREAIEEIERLIMPQKLFMNTILFSQKVDTFFTDLKDAEQKEIFRKILLLDSYVLYQKIATEKITENSNLIASLREEFNTISKLLEETSRLRNEQIELKEQFERRLISEIEFHKGELEESNELLRESNQKCLKYEKMGLQEKWKDILKLITQNDNEGFQFNEKLKSSRIELEGTKSSKEEEFKSKTSLEKASIREKYQEKIKTEETECREKISPLEQEIQNKKLELAINKSEHESLKTRQIDLRGEISKIETVVLSEKKCPTCGQTVDKELIEKFKKDLEEFKKNLKTMESESEEISDIKEKNESIIYKLERDKDELMTLSRIKTRELEELQDKEIYDIQGKLENALDRLEKSFNDSLERVQKMIKDELERIVEEREKLDKEYEEIEALIKEKERADKYRQDLFASIDSLREKIKEKENKEFDNTTLKNCISRAAKLRDDKVDLSRRIVDLEKRGEILSFWKIGFSSSGIPSMLIDEAIPFMNRTIAGYLDEISGGRYTVTFDTLKATKAGEFKDKVSVQVFDSESWANSRVQFSGGQVRIVDIATILTLRSLQNNIQNMKFNLLLFDEIFDSLDDRNIEYVSTLLKTIKQGKTIFIISHKHIDQLEADQVLQFTG